MAVSNIEIAIVFWGVEMRIWKETLKLENEQGRLHSVVVNVMAYGGTAYAYLDWMGNMALNCLMQICI